MDQHVHQLHRIHSRCARRSAPHRHHHGWQRALGEAAPAAARRRPSSGRGDGARNHPRLHCAGRRISHLVRLLERELATSGRRGRVSDAAFPARVGAGSGEAARKSDPLPGDRGPVTLRAACGAAHSRRRGADRRQCAAHAHRRGELRRPLGHHPGSAEAAAGEAGSGARFHARRPHAASVDGLRTGAGSFHTHRRRTAGEQFPALAACLHRALLHRHVVAGLRSGRPGDGHSFLPESRTPLRTHQRAGSGERLSRGSRVPMAENLRYRVLAAIVMIAVLLAAMFGLPPLYWGCVMSVALVLATYEWGKLAAMSGRTLAIFLGGTIVIALKLLWSGFVDGNGWPQWLSLSVNGASLVFWLTVAPLWLASGWRVQSRLGLALAGWLVLVTTWFALVELQSRSPALCLAMMALVWVADSAAYFAGHRFGKRKLAPAISPGKTWEGV